MPQKMSVDEIMSKRKDLQSGATPIVKAAKAPASWNKEARSARFVMNAQTVDRYGDIVVTSGIDTTEFEKNPVALLFHKSREWPIGNWGNLEKMTSGRPPRLEGDVVLLPSGGPVKEVDEAAWMISNGGIRACSIGFMPDWDDYEMILDSENQWTGGIKFNKTTLLECSICAVPASPQALIKDAAGGDMRLARELLEDVLDNWAKTPEGLLVPRAEYEAAHRDIGEMRSTYVVEKDLLPSEPKSVTPATLKASNEEEAKAFVGAVVMLSPGHPENKDWPFDILAKAKGSVIASYIVDAGVNKGVHGLWVEYLEDEYKGMFRGIAADRFVLAAADAATENADEAKSFENAVDEFATKIKAGDDVAFVDMTDGDDQCHVVVSRRLGSGTLIERFVIPKGTDFTKAWHAAEKFRKAAMAMGVNIEVGISDDGKFKAAISSLNDQVETVEKRVDSLFVRIKKFFGGDEKVGNVDPIPTAPVVPRAAPTVDEIAKSKERAAEVRARLISKGMIAAE